MGFTGWPHESLFLSKKFTVAIAIISCGYSMLFLGALSKKEGSHSP
jgi:hypothetical protein